MDLMQKSQLNIVPILALDFSIGNIVEMESGIPSCLHTLNPGVQNDYLDALLALERSFRRYNRFMMAYGVGARTTQGLGSASELCSMTGDYTDPFIESQTDLVNSYEGTLRAVKIAGPVRYHPLLKFVCDLAQMEFGTASAASHIKNYYVLTILMVGLIDDLELAVNEILRAADLPISIVIVKIGNAEDSENDFKPLLERTKTTFEKCERVFIDTLDYNQYRVNQGETNKHAKE